MVDQVRLELTTPALSTQCSNQLSYWSTTRACVKETAPPVNAFPPTKCTLPAISPTWGPPWVAPPAVTAYHPAMLLFPQFNPVALQIGPVAVHWYGLAYVAAFLLGLSYSKYLVRRHPASGITPDKLESLFTYVILGVILGGRLGYVFFYNASYYLSAPLEILKVWQGGMSFHGGFLGVVIAFLWFAWKHQVNVVDLADRIAPAVPIGLLLGRIANFINGELVGRVTSPNLPWSMIFPHVDLQPRHPSQLYEAALEGIILFALLFVVTRKSITRFLPSGIFLTGYALSRILVESFRTPEITHNLGLLQITQGQLLSLPMLVLGLYFLHLASTQKV